MAEEKINEEKAPEEGTNPEVTSEDKVDIDKKEDKESEKVEKSEPSEKDEEKEDGDEDGEGDEDDEGDLFEGFSLVYTEPEKKKLQKIEYIVLAVALILGLIVGIPKYIEYQNLTKAIALMEQAHELSHQGKLDEEKECLDKALGYDPQILDAYKELAVIAYLKGDRDEEVRILQEGVKNMPNNVDIHFELAQTLFLRGDFAEAVEVLDNAIKLDPNDDFVKKLKERAEFYKANPDKFNLQKRQEASKKLFEKESKMLDEQYKENSMMNPSRPDQQDQAQPTQPQVQAEQPQTEQSPTTEAGSQEQVEHEHAHGHEHKH